MDIQTEQIVQKKINLKWFSILTDMSCRWLWWSDTTTINAATTTRIHCWRIAMWSSWRATMWWRWRWMVWLRWWRISIWTTRTQIVGGPMNWCYGWRWRSFCCRYWRRLFHRFTEQTVGNGNNGWEEFQWEITSRRGRWWRLIAAQYKKRKENGKYTATKNKKRQKKSKII